MSGLEDWIARQYAHSAACLLHTISCPVVKTRAHFGQTIVPAKGSVVASAELAAYDPDPDYFFHWYRILRWQWMRCGCCTWTAW